MPREIEILPITQGVDSNRTCLTHHSLTSTPQPADLPSHALPSASTAHPLPSEPPNPVSHGSGTSGTHSQDPLPPATPDMTPERWQRIKQLLDQALALDPSQRASFLDRSCDGDPQLRRELDSLLVSHNLAGTNFLNAPPPDLETVALPSPSSPRGRCIGVYEILEKISLLLVAARRRGVAARTESR